MYNRQVLEGASKQGSVAPKSELAPISSYESHSIKKNQQSTKPPVDNIIVTHKKGKTVEFIAESCNKCKALKWKTNYKQD